MDTGWAEMQPLLITTYDAETGITETRQMTDEEYADLIASGWTPEPEEETSTE